MNHHPSYADRLSSCPNKGVVGLKEIYDSGRSKSKKLQALLQFWKDAKKVVILTGAGISTAAGISDFRGPNGVWTLEAKEKREKRKNKKLKRTTTTSSSTSTNSFETAIPTITHNLLKKFNEKDKVSFVVSQNVDGLHLKSGFPRDFLVELHGNVFMERCNICSFEIFHNNDVGGVGCKETGNVCTKCEKGKMHDTVLDWDTPIVESEMELAEKEMSEADLVICLGTSLRIVPAANLPLLVGSARNDDVDPKFCVINLQETPLDDRADLVLHCNVDEVMTFIDKNLFHSASS